MGLASFGVGALSTSGSSTANVGGGGGDLWGSLVSAASAERANKKNREVMRQQYEREDTVYTRAVQDMRRAGLNPALMFGHGAGAPAGGGNIGKQESVAGDTFHSALAAKRQHEELKLMREQTKELQVKQREGEQNISESEAREALNFAQRNIALTEDQLRKLHLPRARSEANPWTGKSGKIGGWIDWISERAGGIVGAVLPPIAAGKGLLMARKYMQQNDPLERTRAAHETAYASERGRIDARNKFSSRRRK